MSCRQHQGERQRGRCSGTQADVRVAPSTLRTQMTQMTHDVGSLSRPRRSRVHANPPQGDKIMNDR